MRTNSYMSMKLGPHHGDHRPTESLPEPPFYPDGESINFPEGTKFISEDFT